MQIDAGLRRIEIMRMLYVEGVEIDMDVYELFGKRERQI